MKGHTIVRSARRDAGLTQVELAKWLSTIQSVVARWESGRVSPSLDTLSRIAAACGRRLKVIVEPADDHDLGLALQNLKLTPEQQLEQLTNAVRFSLELRSRA